MKQALYIIITTITLCITTSCLQNDGYIGELFGQWRLESIEYESNTFACDTVFFAFQSDIIQVRKVNYLTYEYITFTGLYSRQDDLMQVDFYKHKGNANDAITEEEKAAMLRDLESLYIDVLSPTFVIEKLNWDEMILKYNDYRYIFTKLD